MKRLLFIIIPLALFSCKLSPVEKAKSAIHEEMRTTLHDYKSYEPVQYGKLDSDYSSVEDLPQMKALQKDFDQNVADEKEHFSTMKIYGASLYLTGQYNSEKRIVDADIAKMLSDTTEMGQIRRNFKPQFVGWKIEHSYRAKSLSGNLGIHHYILHLDSSLTKVNYTVDISESATKRD